MTRDEAHQGEQESDPGHRDDEARGDQGLLRAALGESLRGERRDQDADGGRGEDDASLDRVVAANLLEEDGDGKRDAHEQQPLDVLGDEPEVRRVVLEQERGQQGFLAGSLASARVEKEPDEKRGSGRQQRRHQREVAVGLQNPEHDEEHADRRQDRSEPVERTGRVGRERVGDPAAEQDDQRDDRGLEDERGAPVNCGGDETADQRSGRGAEAAQPADDAERPGA